MQVRILPLPHRNTNYQTSMIQSTTDYGQFKSITSNREVDEPHVKRLIKSLEKKNLLQINPIVCNSEMEVVDGQHRLEAATRMGLEIFYIVDSQVSKVDIATINSNAKNWTVMDYINYWTIEKAPGFDKLSHFLNDHPLIPPSSALLMLSADGKRDLAGLKNGFVDATGYPEACEIANILKYFRNYADFAYDRNFILAVITCVQVDGYDHDTMKAKVEMQPRSLVKCINRKQYVEMLEEIYNYRSHKARLRFL